MIINMTSKQKFICNDNMLLWFGIICKVGRPVLWNHLTQYCHWGWNALNSTVWNQFLYSFNAIRQRVFRVVMNYFIKDLVSEMQIQNCVDGKFPPTVQLRYTAWILFEVLFIFHRSKKLSGSNSDGHIWSWKPDLIIGPTF